MFNSKKIGQMLSSFLFLISVIGILEGGHLFTYDVCRDELYLIMGRPEISQLFVNENVEQKSTQENQNYPPNVDKGKIGFHKRFGEIRSPWKSSFVKQSVQVTKLLLYLKKNSHHCLTCWFS